MSTKNANAATDGPDVNKMISEYATQKLEIADLSDAVLSLTKEIRALKDAQRKTTSTNEQDSPSTTPNKRKREQKKSGKYEGEWIDGLEFDKSLPRNKQSWFFPAFKKNEPERWKKWRTGSLKAQLAALE